MSQSALQPLLRVDGLNVTFPSPHGPVESVRDLSFQVNPGEILALVGESGSGKSVTARTLVGLAGERAQIQANAIELVRHDGNRCDLQTLSDRQWQQVRGREIGFVLQDALVSLDPLRRIGQEVAEPLLTHKLASRNDVATRVAELLAQVGIPDPANRAAQYPHELSGGLRQRALIASALAAGPKLLIADEPTTALDATVQQQVLKLFTALAQAGHGVLLITHDLAVVSQVADRVMVMQKGALVERGTAGAVRAATPVHPPAAGRDPDRRDPRQLAGGRKPAQPAGIDPALFRRRVRRKERAGVAGRRRVRLVQTPGRQPHDRGE